MSNTKLYNITIILLGFHNLFIIAESDRFTFFPFVGGYLSDRDMSTATLWQPHAVSSQNDTQRIDTEV